MHLPDGHRFNTDGFIAEFGRNDHRKNASNFTTLLFLTDKPLTFLFHLDIVEVEHPLDLH